jgi:hypothetical protein
VVRSSLGVPLPARTGYPLLSTVVVRELLFCGQPVIDIVPVLTPAGLEEVISKPGDLIS